MHLTGRYPDWWEGRRFDHPIEAWVAGEGGLLVRDGPQTLLCGRPGSRPGDDGWGIGLIPRDCLIDRTLARGVSNLYDTVEVAHFTNGVRDGVSRVAFKSYDQGPSKFQSKTLNWWWADEEPTEEIWGELLARTSATGGSGILTFTPLKGRSKVVNHFLTEQNPSRAFVVMTIHEGIKSKMPLAERERLIAGYPSYQRQARAFGVPTAGEGLVFEIDPESIKEKAMPMHQIPLHWRKLWGIDFGYKHPFGMALLLHDTEADIIHLWFGQTIREQTPHFHVPIMLSLARDTPVAWPHDGETKEKGTGEILKDQYKKLGLKMLPESARWPDNSMLVEPGLTEILDRMRTGKWLVSEACTAFFEEMRLYHRENGLVVRENDDLISASRYAYMMRRYARPGPLGSSKASNPIYGQRTPRAKGLDIEDWKER
jgi:phage terminase large subunit-like protein